MPRTCITPKPKKEISIPNWDDIPEIITAENLIEWGFTRYSSMKILRDIGCVTKIRPFFVHRDAFGKYIGKQKEERNEQFNNNRTQRGTSFNY